MRSIIPYIRRMTYEEQQEYGLVNPGLMLEYQGRSYVLNAGTRDKVEVFAIGVGLYVLTSNQPLSYLGLDEYQIGHQEAINSVFLWKEQEMYEVLGPRWMVLSSEAKVMRMMEYLM